MFSRAFYHHLSLTLATVCSLSVSGAWAQDGDDDFSLDGPSPSVNILDTDNMQEWSLFPDQIGFRIRDVSAGRTVFNARPGARNNAVVLAGRNVGMGTLTPDSLFDLRGLGGTSFKVNTGVSSTPSVAISESTLSAELDLETRRSSQSATLNLNTPAIKFSFKASGSGRFVIRDEVSKRNAITIFPNTANNNVITIRNGNVGIRRGSPTRPLHMQNGAFCSTGGVWTNASSRELKQNIEALDADVALKALEDLQPMTYAYKSEPDEMCAGFIAEDVPELVANNDRKTLAAMDVVAVLTRVVKTQQETLIAQAKEIRELKKSVARQADVSRHVQMQAVAIEVLTQRLEALEKKEPNFVSMNQR